MNLNGIKKFRVTSTAFRDSDPMPIDHTQHGENFSIPLAWEGAPEGVMSYAIIANDPDAPSPRLRLFNFTHWVVYDIPPAITALEPGLPIKARLENGIKQGKNGYGKNGYAGPMPPFGVHRYFFTVYALDTLLGLDPAKTKKKHLVKAIQGHILAQGQIMGTFKKP
ncbi:MAG: YbhB/YbcL family Raf kinase inhibitor-like protein [Desulfatibacillum sp.]|nr:YbhB/YbcL family Raf kinase inhibitor-like protein [Desulfatibacillum sp.]